MSLSLQAILIGAAETLAMSSSLANWGTDTYGRAPLVRIGYDARKLPTAADTPAVAILPVSIAPGAEEAVETITLDVVCWIIDEIFSRWPAVEDEVPLACPVIENTGIARATEFMELVENELADWAYGQDWSLATRITVDAERYFPVIFARAQMTITRQTIIGG